MLRIILFLFLVLFLFCAGSGRPGKKKGLPKEARG